MKKLWLIGLLVIVVVSLTGCAAGPNVFVNQGNPDGEVAGFWQGLWHGLIVFITFIISLFNDNVSVYEIHNNGGWYNFGFLLGVMTSFGGGGRGSSRRRRR